jgi:hypothetical protein
MTLYRPKAPVAPQHACVSEGLAVRAVSDPLGHNPGHDAASMPHKTGKTI